MKHRTWIIGALLATSTALGASAQDYPSISLRQNNSTAATAAPAIGDLWFAEAIDKETGGNIKIQNFWSAAAGAPSEMLKLVGGGALDSGSFPGSYFPAQMPFLGSVSALPMSLPSAAKGQEIIGALWEEVPALQEEAKANNIWPAYFSVLNEYRLLCTSPVRNMADLEGKKIRSQGEYIPLMVQAMGGVPVTVLPGEFYEALQRGTVDCMLLPWDLLYVNRLHEVAKYSSDLSFGALVSHGTFYNLDTWNSFPDNVKELFLSTGKEAEVHDLEGVKAMEADALTAMKEKGLEVIAFEEADALKAKMPDFLEIWQQRMADAGKGDAAAKVVEIWKSKM